MKTKFWIAIIAAVLVICVGLSVLFLLPGQAAAEAEILSDGKLWGTVRLSQDQQFTITNENGGTNTVTVSGGKIGVTQADCPDHYCMHRGLINNGTQIVCLPNKLIIRFVGEQEIDGFVG